MLHITGLRTSPAPSLVTSIYGPVMSRMTRTSIHIDDSTHELAQGANEAHLRHRIERAVRRGGGFVDLVVVGNRRVAALFTPHSNAVFTTVEVNFDARDDGDETTPFLAGPDYDTVL